MYDDSGEIPTGLKEAENPKFEIGDIVILHHGQKPGMEGASAKIVGAFETTAYEATFESMTGGEMVANHKW